MKLPREQDRSMMNIDDYDPASLPLSGGVGGATDPCLQQKAALVHAHMNGYLTPALFDDVFTDRPCWQNRVINVFGIHVNDRLPAGSPLFALLDAMIPRVVAATKRSDPDVEHRVNARLLCWLARQVLHLVPEEDREACETAINTREAWLTGDATEAECTRAAAGAAGVVGAAGAARAAWAARAAGAVNTVEAARAAGAARVAGAARAVNMFDELLDQWAKACAEEGVVVDDGWIAALKEAGLVSDGFTPALNRGVSDRGGDGYSRQAQ